MKGDKILFEISMTLDVLQDQSTIMTQAYSFLVEMSV